jgi:hypothetical protein
MVRRYAAALGLSGVFHLLLALVLAGPPGAPTVLSPTLGHAMRVFVVSPPEDATFAGLNPVDRTREDLTRPPDSESSTMRIGDVRIDLDRIRAHAQVLFPFLTPGLSLDHFLPAMPGDPNPRLEVPLAALSTSREEARVRRPLALSETELQGVVDKAWARHERWAAFEPIRKMTDTFQSNTGQLPGLIQRYIDQNSLQPYADGDIRDPRLWAQLGIAADHVSFIAFIRRYAAAHPRTRTTTELLFLLDKLAEANQDALSVLRDTDPQEQLSWTRQANPEAFVWLIEIRQYYQHELDRRGLVTGDDIDRYYEKGRLAILEGIVRTTPDGYRANDARFLIGEIYWRQGSIEEALRSWRQIAPDRNDSYFIASGQIAAALRGPRLIEEVTRILRNQHGRWLSFSDDRLRQFGYRFDSF